MKKYKTYLDRKPDQLMMNIIEYVAAAPAKSHNILLLCRYNTFASPYRKTLRTLRRYAMHSATVEYIGGHSDSALLDTNQNDESFSNNLFIQKTAPVSSRPRDCLYRRGDQKNTHISNVTLPGRMEKNSLWWLRQTKSW